MGNINMLSKTGQTAIKTPQQIKPAQRMFYIDNLRLFFTVLVILHHVCLTYGAHSGWYFYEYLQDAFTNLFLNVLMAVNRTWVIGCFLMVSGYFTPGSLDKKGTWGFMKERLIRLGIPLALFSFLIRPTLVYTMNRDTLSQHYTYLENIFLMKNVAPGPAWFLEALLIFSFAYAIWRLAGKSRLAGERAQRPFPKDHIIVLFIIALAASTFVTRIFFPTEREVFHLRLGNYAGYIAFFSVGIVAYRHKWFDKLTDATGRQWTIITIITLCVYTSFVISARSSHTSLSFLRGGLSAKTLIATYTETFIAVGSSISLVHLFRKFLNGQPGIVRTMAKDAYAVFIFHAPIIVALSYIVRGMLPGYPFVKFLSVFISGTALCFLICRFVVRKLPYAQKIF